MPLTCSQEADSCDTDSISYVKAINGVGEGFARSATHDISRTNFHVKHIGAFARRLEDVCSPPTTFPSRINTNSSCSRRPGHFQIEAALHRDTKRSKPCFCTGDPMTSLSSQNWRTLKGVCEKTIPLELTYLPYHQKTHIWS